MIKELIIASCIIITIVLIFWYCQKRWKVLYDPRIKAHQLWVPNDEEKVIILDPTIPNNSQLGELPKPLPSDWFVLYEPNGKEKYRFYFVHRVQWIPRIYINQVLAPNLKLIIVRREGRIPEVHDISSDLVKKMISGESSEYYMFGVVIFEGWGDKVSND